MNPKIKTCNFNYLLWTVFSLTTFFTSAQQNATATEATKKYVTYPFSDPNPIPSDTKIYPYFRFDGFTDKGIVKEWKTVVLENDYIKVRIMPQIGGKVWSAYDKKRGKDFLYNNGVVKFRDIAMRGPWVSGGIETNYGIIGHTPNSATPVDYLVRNNTDGSVSCFTSTLDLLTRTRWVVETKLEKDKAYFTTRSYWFNATGVEQPYYTWMNAGIPVGNELQFLYPGNHYLGHDGSVHNWPIDDQGRNLSHYSENNFGPSKSYHVFGAHSDYFGALWKKDDFGMIHYANRDGKLGKKIFLWAQSDQGKIWEDLLTDNSGQYVEIQSGRLFNQNIVKSSFTPFKQVGFAPYNSDRWTEYWYPFAGINGLSDANKVGAFHTQMADGKLSVKISPVQAINDSLRVYTKEGKKIASVYVKAAPFEVIDLKMAVPKNEKPAQLELKGTKMDLQQNSDPKFLDRPLHIAKGFDPESAYGLYLQGRDLYNFRNYQLAEEKIRASLKKEKQFQPSLVEMVKLKLFKMQYDSAFYYSKKALRIDTYNGAANYYYGLSASKLSKNDDVLDGFEVAALTPEFRNAAYTALSHQYLQLHDYAKAKEYAHLSLDAHPDNRDALQILHVLARIQGDTVHLKETKANLLALNPLNHFVRFERYLEFPTERNKNQFKELIRSELPVETYLELAIWYADNERLEESRGVLELAQKNAEVLYWLAWLYRDVNPNKSAEYRQQAEHSPISFVFPFREETAAILEWASKQKTSWKADYLLSLIHNFKGNKTIALSLLKKYDNQTVNFAPFYVMRAKLDGGASPITKLKWMEKAVQLEPNQWRYGTILSNLWLQINNEQKAIGVLENYFKANKTNYIIGLELAKTYLLDNRFTKAEKLLSHLQVLPFEGATDAHKYYRQTKLMLAYGLMKKDQYGKALKKIGEAQEWPRNLGVGKPYPDLIDMDLENLMKALIYKRMGDTKSFMEYRNQIKDQSLEEASLLKAIKAISFDPDQRMF